MGTFLQPSLSSLQSLCSQAWTCGDAWLRRFFYGLHGPLRGLSAHQRGFVTMHGFGAKFGLFVVVLAVLVLTDLDLWQCLVGSFCGLRGLLRSLLAVSVLLGFDPGDNCWEHLSRSFSLSLCAHRLGLVLLVRGLWAVFVVTFAIPTLTALDFGSALLAFLRFFVFVGLLNRLADYTTTISKSFILISLFSLFAFV